MRQKLDKSKGIAFIIIVTNFCKGDAYKIKSLIEVKLKKLAKLLEDTGEMRCEKCFASIES